MFIVHEAIQMRILYFECIIHADILNRYIPKRSNEKEMAILCATKAFHIESTE